MKTKALKPLIISGITSFIVVFGGWIWDRCFFEKSNYIGFVGAILWWLPGVLILSIFKGGWAVIHVDRWIKLTPVISFVFWFIIILGIRKGYLVLTKKFLITKLKKDESAGN